MDSQQRDELRALVRKAVAKEVQRAAVNQDVEQLTLDEAEANARIRERLTAVETELKVYRWIAGIVLAVALALLRFWPR
jgi:hypothetical protein